MIMDHVGLTVGDYEKSKRFYSSALAPLGIELVATRNPRDLSP
jgi:catechol 2,3-dioxygenase-like lactoylglutathione lyase family enzyme